VFPVPQGSRAATEHQETQFHDLSAVVDPIDVLEAT